MIGKLSHQARGGMIEFSDSFFDHFSNHGNCNAKTFSFSEEQGNNALDCLLCLCAKSQQICRYEREEQRTR